MVCFYKPHIEFITTNQFCQLEIFCLSIPYSESFSFFATICRSNDKYLQYVCFNAQKRPGFTGALQFKPVLLIVLQLLSYVAQTEREFNRQRQAEEIAATKARGVHFGCSFKDRGEDYRPVMDVWQRGELSGRAAAPEIGRGTQDLPVVM